MFQPRGLWVLGCALGGWLATSSLDGRAGAVGPTGQPRDLAQRNEASTRLGALSKYSTSLLNSISCTHTHTHTLRVVAITIAHPIVGAEWSVSQILIKYPVLTGISSGMADGPIWRSKSTGR